ncbi:unnamed protein product [Adineta steineri]|uniref:Uncharacterized protein n=1 Tax=Adineta steineri TaxID=433720 RepID=A0A813Q2E1_9BILA|nr:unnamed protein product [Adineta steineri]CAF3691205.1 unnamed protein product [Adineta steineri]
MAIRVTHHKSVAVRVILRKSLKRRSKFAKHRKHTKNSAQSARSLITSNQLKESTRVTHVSTTKKIVKSKQKDKEDNDTQHDAIQSHDNTHITSESYFQQQQQNIDPTENKTILVTPPSINYSNQTHHSNTSSYLPQPNRKNINLLNETTTKSSSSLINKTFSILARSNKQSSVHPTNEQQNQQLSKKKKKPIPLCVIILASALSCLLITGIILAIVIPLTIKKNTATISATSMSTTLTPVCTTSSTTACSTVMYNYLNSLYSAPGGWVYVSCCYIAPTMNQITIDFGCQEDDTGYWMIDDVSAQQNGGELISNGGFESGLSNWTSTVYSNATSSTTVDTISGSQHSNSAYLQCASANAPSYVKQIFSIIQGQNTLISFWWNYTPELGFPSGTSELTVTLT